MARQRFLYKESLQMTDEIIIDDNEHFKEFEDAMDKIRQSKDD